MLFWCAAAERALSSKSRAQDESQSHAQTWPQDFESVFAIKDDGTLSSMQDLIRKLAVIGGKKMYHTDKQTLHRV